MSIRKQYQTDCPNPECRKVVELSIAHKLRAEQNELLCQCSSCGQLFQPYPSEITRTTEQPAVESSMPGNSSEPQSPFSRTGLPTYQPPTWNGNVRVES